MGRLRKWLPVGALALLVFWAVANAERLSEADEVFIRAVLGALFYLALLLRRKPEETALKIPKALIVACFPVGALLAAVGLVVPMNMVEWLGVLLLVTGAMMWGLPVRFYRDLVVGTFLLFWIHPLPSQLFNALQDTMQQLSVSGSELFLQGANVPVWADGIVLSTGYQDFLVPEACSGMRTSLTVLYCVLGVGVLLRLRVHTIVVFMVTGLLHVLVFNIARISYMVLWAPKMPREWADTFLHDTLGFFLLVCIILVQAEMGGWVAWRNRRRRIREGIRNGELERPDKASIVPGSIRKLGYIALILAAIAAPVGVGFFVRERLESSHRGEMLRRVVEGFVATDLSRANGCIEEALVFLPGDRRLLVRSCYVDVLSGRYLAALAKFDELGVETLGIDEQAMRAWALMRLGRVPEARAVLGRLPASANNRPGVAMLRAEFGAMDQEPIVVAEYVRHAARSYLMVPRIRALLPFLARHEQWDTIAAVDSPRPFSNPLAALVTVRAHLLTQNYSAASRVLLSALETWPDDMQFQWAIHEFARRRGGEWVELFAAQAERNIEMLNPDELARTAERALGLGRADVAWRMYLWLLQLDDAHPMLHYLPARYGAMWLNFQHERLEVSASTGAILSIGPVLSMLDRVQPFASFAGQIPLYELLSGAGADERSGLLRKAAEAFKQRMDAGRLAVLDQFTYVRTLSMLQEWDEAHDILDQIAEGNPQLASMVLLQHATLYFERGERQACYEALREYDEAGGARLLFAEMMQIASMGGENQAVSAYQHLLEARTLFPGDPRLSRAEAVLWLVYGCPEEAYHKLMERPDELRSPVGYEALVQTGRLRQARQVGDVLGFNELSADYTQPYTLLPANRLLVMPRLPEDQEAWARARATVARERAEKAVSPYIRAVNERTAVWCDAYAGIGDFPARDAWRETGRDLAEQASSLYRLALLHTTVGELEKAHDVLEEAVEMAPDSLPLWRLYVSCAVDRTQAIARASAECPSDPALWALQQSVLVDKGQLDMVAANLKAHIEARDRPIEHLVRVAEYCRRAGRADIAKETADALLLDDLGFMPLLVLGIDAGIGSGDLDFSIRCTLHAIEAADDPLPFFKILVNLKAAAGQVDADLVAALDRLSQSEPDAVRWDEQLGLIYFQTGRMRQALAAFRSVFDRDAAQASQTSMLLAAEAARQENRYAEAVRLLESAYARDPERLVTVNNLVYLLAQRQATLARAQEMLPVLLERAGENAAILDTIAYVYRQIGDLSKAESFSKRAISLVREGSYEKSEVLLNAARIRLAAGDVEDAKMLLEQVRSEGQIPVSVDVEARRLMGSLELQ